MFASSLNRSQLSLIFAMHCYGRAIAVCNKCILGQERKIRGSSFNLSTWWQGRRRFIFAGRLTRAALFFNFHQRRHHALSDIYYSSAVLPVFVSRRKRRTHEQSIGLSLSITLISLYCDSTRFLSFCFVQINEVAS